MGHCALDSLGVSWLWLREGVCLFKVNVHVYILEKFDIDIILTIYGLFFFFWKTKTFQDVTLKLPIITAPYMSIASNVFFLINGKTPSSKPVFPTPGFCLEWIGIWKWGMKWTRAQESACTIQRRCRLLLSGKVPGHTTHWEILEKGSNVLFSK